MAVQTEKDIRVVNEPFNRPLPNIDQDNEEFWDGLKEHRLMLWRCRTCGEWYWPKSYCIKHPNEAFAANVELAEGSGRGKVYAFNIHHWSFHPGFKDMVPYAYGLIELEEGPLISSLIVDIAPQDVKVGMPVEVVYEDHPTEGFTLPLFKPAG